MRLSLSRHRSQICLAGPGRRRRQGWLLRKKSPTQHPPQIALSRRTDGRWRGERLQRARSRARSDGKEKDMICELNEYLHLHAPRWAESVCRHQCNKPRECRTTLKLRSTRPISEQRRSPGGRKQAVGGQRSGQTMLKLPAIRPAGGRTRSPNRRRSSCSFTSFEGGSKLAPAMLMLFIRCE